METTSPIGIFWVQSTSAHLITKVSLYICAMANGGSGKGLFSLSTEEGIGESVSAGKCVTLAVLVMVTIGVVEYSGSDEAVSVGVTSVDTTSVASATLDTQLVIKNNAIIPIKAWIFIHLSFPFKSVICSFTLFRDLAVVDKDLIFQYSKTQYLCLKQHQNSFSQLRVDKPHESKHADVY